HRGRDAGRDRGRRRGRARGHACARSPAPQERERLMTPSADDLAFLQTIPIFGGLAGPALERVAVTLVDRRVGAGERLVREGEPGREMFVVRAGVVEVFKCVGPIETRLALLHPGACFGEMALIDIQPRSADVRAAEDAVIWSLRHADLAALWKNDS